MTKCKRPSYLPSSMINGMTNKNEVPFILNIGLSNMEDSWTREIDNSEHPSEVKGNLKWPPHGT